MKSIYWISIIAVIIILAGIDKCSSVKKMEDISIALANYTGEVKEMRLSNNALVASNKSLELITQDQMKEIAAKNDTVKQMIKKFKQVQNITYITNNFEASGDSSNFNKPIPCEFNPFKDTLSTPNYTLEQTVSRNGIKVDRLFIPNEQKLVFGTKRVGLFKTEHTVDVNNSNELMKVSNIKNYTFVPEKRWYEKWWVHSLLGVGVGSAGTIFLNNAIKR